MKQYNLKATKRQMSFGELTVIALGKKDVNVMKTLSLFKEIYQKMTL